MKTYSIEGLTKEQLKLITETLIFSSSCSVNSKWYQEETKEIADIAINIRKNFPDIILENLWIIDNPDWFDEYTTNILQYFPELLQTLEK